MPALHGTKQTAERLGQLVPRRRLDRRRRVEPGRRPPRVTWVKVTGDADGDGWFPGVASIDGAGTFDDLAAPVLVRGPADEDLANGTRYLCTRTGDDDSGKARFRATIGGALGDRTVSVKVTGNAAGGTYPANLTTRDPDTLAVTLGAGVLAVGLNDESLENGTRYLATFIGANANGCDVYEVTTKGELHTVNHTAVTNVTCANGTVLDGKTTWQITGRDLTITV
jgi:hypothetical protein